MLKNCLVEFKQSIYSKIRSSISAFSDISDEEELLRRFLNISNNTVSEDYRPSAAGANIRLYSHPTNHSSRRPCSPIHKENYTTPWGRRQRWGGRVLLFLLSKSVSPSYKIFMDFVPKQTTIYQSDGMTNNKGSASSMIFQCFLDIDTFISIYLLNSKPMKNIHHWKRFDLWWWEFSTS